MLVPAVWNEIEKVSIKAGRVLSEGGAMFKKKILVTGATGQQGGEVVRALLEKGHKVRALVRNTDSEKAKKLREKKVELASGNFDDPPSITKAARGVDGAFVVSTPFDPSVGADGEVRQGVSVIDAVKEASVPHVVLSSVSDADLNTGIPHFDSKAKVEEHLKKSGLNYTITAPVYFADNTTADWNLEILSSGVLSLAMPPDRKLQVITVRDIGRFNACVLERGAELSGKRFNYAGDELSGKEQAKVISKVSGREVRFVEASLDSVRANMSEDLALMYEWFVKTGYSADIPALRKDFPEVPWQSYEDWAKEVDWKALLGEN